MLETMTITSVTVIFLSLGFLVYLDWGHISALFRRTQNTRVEIPVYDLEELSANVRVEREVLARLWKVTDNSFQISNQLKKFEKALKEQENVIHRLEDIRN